MKGPTLVLVLLMLALPSACGTPAPDDGRPGVVASLYPFAWAVERIGGDSVRVTDLTPAGVEAHEVSLNAEQREEISQAEVLVHVGDIGFQPDVEAAMGSADGTSVTAEGSSGLLTGSGDLSFDPHVWLDPARLAAVAGDVSAVLQDADPPGAEGYARRTEELDSDLSALDAEFRNGLADCEYRTFVTTHEAFAYIAEAYDLEQVGVQGLVPESEPDAASIQRTVGLIESGDAAPVVFAEPTDEGNRMAEAIASDAGVPVAALSPVESAPDSGDYLSAMRENLESLRKGLSCR